MTFLRLLWCYFRLLIGRFSKSRLGDPQRPQPANTVQFFVDGEKSGSPIPVPSTGIVSHTLSGLLAGTYTITARYSGNPRLGSSISSPLVQTVVPARSATAVFSRRVNRGRYPYA